MIVSLFRWLGLNSSVHADLYFNLSMILIKRQHFDWLQILAWYTLEDFKLHFWPSLQWTDCFFCINSSKVWYLNYFTAWSLANPNSHHSWLDSLLQDIHNSQWERGNFTNWMLHVQQTMKFDSHKSEVFLQIRSTCITSIASSQFVFGKRARWWHQSSFI